MITSTIRPRNIVQKLVLVALLLTFWTLAITSIRNKSCTFDEIQHVTAGYSYWSQNDFRLHPENGILSQKLIAFPLLFSDDRFPDLSQPAWWNSNVLELGYEFLYRSGNNADWMLLKGRMVIATLGVALGLLVYFWSRRLFGKAGAMLSLTLYTFCPTLLANSSLATSDVVVALFFILAVFAYWKMLHGPDLKNVLFSSLAIAGLFLAKFSAFVFVLMAVLLLIVRFLFGPKLENKSIPRVVGIALAHVAVLWLAVWTFYGFRYSSFNPADPHPAQLFEKWEHFDDVGLHSILQFAREEHLLPESYLYGFATVLKHGQSRRAFLNGNYSLHGWWYFFPYSFFVKTPLPTFVILALSILAGLITWKRTPKQTAMREAYHATPLFVLLLVYWIVAITSSLNIGHRHILPTYPAILILAGGAAQWLRGPRMFPKILLTCMLIWLIAETIFTYPNFLTYFNEVAGGPKNGYNHLVDSSSDWGQDLAGMKSWMDNHPARRPVYLSYFGVASPEYYGIEVKRLPSYIELGQTPEETELMEGTYAISATMLQSVYSYAAGHWSVPYEHAYQKLLKNTSSDADRFYLRQLRFARLCAYLRHRTPVDSVGNSILIFRVTDEDLHRALLGPPLELVPQIDMR